MHGEYQGIANEIAGRIHGEENEGGVRPEHLPDIIPGIGEGNVNCYPGGREGDCHEVAFFFSLTGKRRKGRGDGHYDFHQTLQKLVQHMQGHCPGKTRVGLFFCDSWSSEALDPWYDNIKAIMNGGVHLEFYLLCKNSATLLDI